ncbi:MAG: 2,3-diketo-5-methylthiopentyl-phosphate enolase [Acidobacteriota bacterium]|nr:2,3-diketo-5-methylthiopentyl-phosphate enolase [Acidobacteriota bacterium]
MRVHYELALAAGETAGGRASAIAREQTVEIPAGVAAAEIERRTIGVVAAVEEVGSRRARATIDYPWRELVSDLPQLVNLLYGNISLQRGIRIAGVDWPAELLRQFPGPAFGVAGLRELTGVAGRPLLAGALKPVGLGVRELARLAGECARGGLDLIKDDHSLADQPSAPFRERVLTVAEHVARANRQGGRSCLYVPNLTGPVDRLGERLDDLRDAGVRAAMVAPLLLGLDTVRSLATAASGAGIALIGHPAFAGSLVAPRQGLAPELLFGDLFRIAGCDVVIYPNAGGRFPFTLRDCRAIQGRLLAPLGGLRPAFAMVAGGIDAAKLERWLPEYAVDTIFLLGGSLLGRPDVAAAASELSALVAGPVRRRRRT